jgi:hypothetical protein
MRQKILAASLFSVCLLLGVGFESSALAQSDPVDGSLSGTLATDSNTEESLIGTAIEREGLQELRLFVQSLGAGSTYSAELGVQCSCINVRLAIVLKIIKFGWSEANFPHSDATEGNRCTIPRLNGKGNRTYVYWNEFQTCGSPDDSFAAHCDALKNHPNIQQYLANFLTANPSYQGGAKFECLVQVTSC